LADFRLGWHPYHYTGPKEFGHNDQPEGSALIRTSGNLVFPQATALHNYIPYDRGFLYGGLLRPLAVWPHSLSFLVRLQAILSGIAAWLLAVNLKALGASFRWVAIAE